ncbi:MAG: LysM peptidoglycan-binding domain-containing protein [Chloroflexi bacterium]|nr:LysM peptidoglycan-binding domain-containing protein [Chloroflexota bacterium]
MNEGPSPGGIVAVADPIVCPYLGLADDPRSHFAFATAAHRCHSASRPERIEVTHQGSFCLSPDYPACGRYVVPAGPAPGSSVLPGRAAEVPVEVVRGRVRWRAGGARLRRLAFGAAFLLVGLIAVAILAAGLLRHQGPLSAGPSGVSGASPAVGQASPAVGQASPTASPPPTPSASLTPTVGPTTIPTRTHPPLPTTHVVARGETLISIARLYGVTAAAIEKANGIKDPNLITVGQRLIIPAP